MQAYLIAIDLDGTTLNNQSQLSPYTIQVLQQVRDMGHLVVIATGRPYRNSQQFYKAIDPQAPILNLNGAYGHYPGRPNWQARYEAEVPREPLARHHLASFQPLRLKSQLRNYS